MVSTAWDVCSVSTLLEILHYITKRLEAEGKIWFYVSTLLEILPETLTTS